MFNKIIFDNFLINKDQLMFFLEKKVKENSTSENVVTNLYNMNVFIDYNRLYHDFCETEKEITRDILIQK